MQGEGKIMKNSKIGLWLFASLLECCHQAWQWLSAVPMVVSAYMQ